MEPPVADSHLQWLVIGIGFPVSQPQVIRNNFRSTLPNLLFVEKAWNLNIDSRNKKLVILMDPFLILILAHEYKLSQRALLTPYTDTM